MTFNNGEGAIFTDEEIEDGTAVLIDLYFRWMRVEKIPPPDKLRYWFAISLITVKLCDSRS